jgi:DNA-binding FadR family transcriptional regulator
MAAARRTNLSEQVAGWIKQLILDEGLNPGDRLPTEQEMAARFGVSRVSIREATKALSFLGIIRAAPRRGLTIGEIDMARVTEYLGFQFALSGYPRSQLLRSRLVIEAGVMPYIVEALAANPQLGDKLDTWLASGSEAATDEQRVANDIAFHRTLLETSGVGPLLVFDDLLQIFFSRFEAHVSDENWQITLDHHIQLVDLLRKGDVGGAQRLIAVHLEGYEVRAD